MGASSDEEDEGFVAFEEDSNDIAIHEESSGEYSDDEEDVIEAPKAGTVIYVGRIPHGFFEQQMRSFFGQFGPVSRVKVARAPKSSRSRGYGWVQFKDPNVAGIACKAMDGYMMHRKKLVVRVLSPEQVGPRLFRNSKRKLLPSRRPQIHKAQVNAEMTEERREKLIKANERKEKKRNAKFAELGIDYQFGAVAEPAVEQDKQEEPQQAAVEQPEQLKAKKKKQKKAAVVK